ncbi:phage scaffolding protein [Sporosarcina sp. SAFN-015]|uniref:phage scaffolding protein n=1 Tax=Sporosarcina sp. SAFN-015 TaxID=3387274 RepID=UPI003F7F61A0
MTNHNEYKLPLTLDLQFFAEEGADDKDVQDGADNGDNGADKPKVVTMTQEEFDAIIVREKGRVKGKYADYDELKQKLAEFEAQKAEAERAQMSEIERLQADLKAKEEAEQTLAKQLEEMREQTKQAAIHNAFIAQAKAAGVTYTDAALKLADLTAAQIGEDGKVSGVDEIVTKLVEDNPFLIAKKQPTEIGEPTNGGKGAADEKTKEQLLEEATEKARKSGRLEDRAAVAQLKRELGL